MSTEAIVPDAVIPAKMRNQIEASSSRHSRESGNPLSFARYPKYKDRGVAWLGQVPSLWRIDRLKHHARLVTDKATVRAFPVALENIEGWSGRFVQTEGEFQGDGIAFEAADILFGKLRPYLAKVYLTDRAGEAVGDFHVLRFGREVVPRYAQYQMLQREFIDTVDGSTFGSKMPRASWEFLGAMPFVLPSHDEQSAIATFLDRETTKIDALIAEQEKLIALLKEKRQALISDAVTKGLDANAPMKDSGIEWLGQVPAHWQLKRLKHVKAKVPNAFVDGPFGSNLKSEHFVDDGDVYVIESNFATQRKLNEAELKMITSEHFATIQRSQVKGGDIVIAKIGAQFGRSAILPFLDLPAVVSGNSMKLTVDPNECTTDWMLLQLENLKASSPELELMANGSAQPALALGSMNELPILAPPLAEQRDIVEAVANGCARLSELDATAFDAIALLKERRAALISAAVTGKIDVRQVA